MAQQARFTPGQKVLLIGEGEGRNGVWLARQGLEVTAVDQSQTGLARAGGGRAFDCGSSITT
ncbi:hypothetical protein [Thiohalophilus sp.]|uniref:SAM-dependent methyltransferase n=1 Tax=Thiohalophilus sp. TaxID=3028392 RepID=UPI002ACD54F0|nr:hypothetical protein [Thiohalophilus sp.]MDZ7661986.1 hypothetical protein [Thiohalophilus sp.]